MQKIKRMTLYLSIVIFSPALYGASDDAAIHVKVCKAALSSIMGVDDKTIHAEQRKEGSISLYYRLEGEKERYDYKCRVDGSRVIWGSALGRWRTDKEDALITFSISDAHITIEERFTDEPVSQASRTTFPLSEL
ncbi:MAG TPA: hypothetical protein ENO02_10535 [Epsilonproteobacteria bacterium]|nr:hypothetical protein [Campylobacterota bacterium]